MNYVSHISYFYRRQTNIFQSTMLLLLHCKKGLPFSHPLPGCHLLPLAWNNLIFSVQGEFGYSDIPRLGGTGNSFIFFYSVSGNSLIFFYSVCMPTCIWRWSSWSASCEESRRPWGWPSLGSGVSGPVGWQTRVGTRCSIPARWDAGIGWSEAWRAPASCRERKLKKH